jgi:hypothetical protein
MHSVEKVEIRELTATEVKQVSGGNTQPDGPLATPLAPPTAPRYRPLQA